VESAVLDMIRSGGKGSITSDDDGSVDCIVVLESVRLGIVVGKECALDSGMDIWILARKFCMRCAG
jgi:hypothetical protein